MPRPPTWVQNSLYELGRLLHFSHCLFRLSLLRLRCLGLGLHNGILAVVHPAGEGRTSHLAVTSVLSSLHIVHGTLYSPCGEGLSG